MQKQFVLSLLLIASVVMPTAFLGCKKKEGPSKKELRLVLEDHFNRKIYNNYVQVLGINIVEDANAEYLGGQYYDAWLKIRIRVKKGFVVSQRFTATSFEVNEELPELYERQMAEAKTDEERKEINDLFNTNTFSEGNHEIEGFLGFVFLEGRWQLLSLMLSPKATKDAPPL